MNQNILQGSVLLGFQASLNRREGMQDCSVQAGCSLAAVPVGWLMQGVCVPGGSREGSEAAEVPGAAAPG